MASLSFSTSSNIPKNSTIFLNSISTQKSIKIKCLANKKKDGEIMDEKILGIGSPIVITEAPQMIKTAASVPCLRLNSGLVKPGDVGRIVSRKPKDVWAVRLSIGTYLIDGKYFKGLEIDDE